MRPVIGRGMYGQWGTVTDPGERTFSKKVKELGVDIGNSPYPDYRVNQIAADFNAAPADAIRLLWGSSLGANNCPVVATDALHVAIHGMWGFQASEDGAKWPVPRNVLFAHEVYNPIWLMTLGLGHYKWVLAPGNTRTTLVLSKKYDLHPGETEQVQAMFLAEMKRVIEAAQAAS
jgi:hypothetical protein